MTRYKLLPIVIMICGVSLSCAQDKEDNRDIYDELSIDKDELEATGISWDEMEVPSDYPIPDFIDEETAIKITKYQYYRFHRVREIEKSWDELKVKLYPVYNIDGELEKYIGLVYLGDGDIPSDGEIQSGLESDYDWYKKTIAGDQQPNPNIGNDSLKFWSTYFGVKPKELGHHLGGGYEYIHFVVGDAYFGLERVKELTGFEGEVSRYIKASRFFAEIKTPDGRLFYTDREEVFSEEDIVEFWENDTQKRNNNYPAGQPDFILDQWHRAFFEIENHPLIINGSYRGALEDVPEDLPEDIRKELILKDMGLFGKNTDETDTQTLDDVVGYWQSSSGAAPVTGDYSNNGFEPEDRLYTHDSVSPLEPLRNGLSLITTISSDAQPTYLYVDYFNPNSNDEDYTVIFDARGNDTTDDDVPIHDVEARIPFTAQLHGYPRKGKLMLEIVENEYFDDGVKLSLFSGRKDDMIPLSQEPIELKKNKDKLTIKGLDKEIDYGSEYSLIVEAPDGNYVWLGKPMP